MLKKILIGVGILVIILVAGFLYLNNRNRTLSPPGSTELTNGDLTVSISYSRPSAKGRMIFGTKEEGALQPYGTYWRLGANESTEITLNRDVKFHNQSLKAGTYRMYAIPGKENFSIVLNSELGKWGAFKPNTALDILRTAVPVQKPDASVEQYTIRQEAIENGMNIIFEWAETKFVVPITVQ